MKLLTYASTDAIRLWLASAVLIVLSFVVGLGVFGSTVALSFGCSAALMMWLPLVRQLAPVAYSVVVKGRWPARQ
ncbi:hypothetical protein HA052_04165 [Chromobacterium haemolyticum]|uniref:Uncharacterized protein n=1 Tax=Chromobacterium fluminis TaxID=3044269 RepID=A0ABX0L0R3_9NEIS|nr:hypothetical protein [Chromobacterium haemolyticum]NHR04385.1 hypothetical protein [Chromobacterium haemolyticum]